MMEERNREDQAHHEVAAALMTVVHGSVPVSTSLSLFNHHNEPQKNPQEDCKFTTLFSSIGVGIDESGCTTEACIKAIRDASARGKLNASSVQLSNYRYFIRLGVPGLPTQRPGVPQNINTCLLTDILPSGIHTHFEIQCGGLLVASTEGGTQHDTCIVVASLTLQQKAQQVVASTTNTAVRSPTSVTSSPPTHSFRNSPPPGEIFLQQAAEAPSTVPRVPTSWIEVEMMMQQKQVPNKQNECQAPQEHGPSLSCPSGPMRNKSIEMLAHISSEMIIAQQSSETSCCDFLATTLPESAEIEDESRLLLRSNGSFKKLPPGNTPKNHKRLFVKHTYRDHSHEAPHPEELDLVGPRASLRTPNATFPLKLHEIMSQIELDGHDDIIGWLHHGRSFKIRKQKDFVEKILPKYFVMTKKSSFLRQLNLYGFNRLSQVGNDQGSYYHELFLRGMKYLSRRIQRQKVNGKGIRAAGNPDEEPSLSHFSPCPPAPIKSLVRGNVPSHEHLKLFQGIQENAHSQQRHHHSNNVVNGTMEKPLLATRAFQQCTPASDAVDTQEQAAAASLRQLQEPSEHLLRQHVTVSFPLKLQRILDKLEADASSADIVSWQSHGRAFTVHDPERFVNEIMPLYFKQTKYSSFQRQCHMYRFERITAGLDKNAYHNEYFLRGRPDLAVKLQRTRVNGKGTRRPGNPLQEPNLYDMSPMPPIKRGTVIDIPTDSQSGHSTGDSVSAVGSEDELEL